MFTVDYPIIVGPDEGDTTLVRVKVVVGNLDVEDPDVGIRFTIPELPWLYETPRYRRALFNNMASCAYNLAVRRIERSKSE